MSDEELVALLARLSQEQQCPVPRLLSALDHPATRNGSNDYHHTTAATTTRDDTRRATPALTPTQRSASGPTC
jgi:hypothetical protein